MRVHLETLAAGLVLGLSLWGAMALLEAIEAANAARAAEEASCPK